MPSPRRRGRDERRRRARQLLGGRRERDAHPVQEERDDHARARRTRRATPGRGAGSRAGRCLQPPVGGLQKRHEQRSDEPERVQLRHHGDSRERRPPARTARGSRVCERASERVGEHETEHREENVGPELDRHRGQARRGEPEDAGCEPPGPVAEQRSRTAGTRAAPRRGRRHRRGHGRRRARSRGRAACRRRSACARPRRGSAPRAACRRRRRRRSASVTRQSRMVDEADVARPSSRLSAGGGVARVRVGVRPPRRAHGLRADDERGERQRRSRTERRPAARPRARGDGAQPARRRYGATLNFQNAKTCHAQQQPAVPAAADVRVAVGPRAVAHRHVDDLQVQPGRAEEQVEVAEGVEVAEVRAAGGDPLVVPPEQAFVPQSVSLT